jgi:hypothetical protein
VLTPIYFAFFAGVYVLTTLQRYVYVPLHKYEEEMTGYKLLVEEELAKRSAAKAKEAS